MRTIEIKDLKNNVLKTNYSYMDGKVNILSMYEEKKLDLKEMKSKVDFVKSEINEKLKSDKARSDKTHKEFKKLVDRLKKDKDITRSYLYKGRDKHFDYFYVFSGLYRGNRFELICSSSFNVSRFGIDAYGTDFMNLFEAFLKTKTSMDIEIVLK